MSTATAPAPIAAAPIADVLEAPAATAPAAAAPAAPAAKPASAAIVANGKVQVVFPAEGGSPIHAYPNGTHGWIGLRSTTTQMGKSWARPVTRYMNYKGEIATLENIIRNEMKASDKSLPGKLVVKEFIYDEDFCDVDNPDTAEYFKSLNLSIEDDDERIAKVVKRDGGGANAPTLKVGDYPIVKFTDYDHTREEHDQLIAYDNFEQVAEYRTEFADEIAALRKQRA